MAGEDGTTADSVIHRLLSNCQEFSFFQAVRLLEHLHPQSASIGRQGPAERETIRFRPHASMAFPTCDVESIEAIETGTELPLRFLMTINFLGLYGPTSPLPDFYTEEIIWADPEESNRRHFLDLFHHRLISLFYRCWEKYRYYALYQSGATDHFSQWMFALTGLGDTGLRERGCLQWPRLLSLLGLLGMKVHSASVLAGIVSHYFGGLPVRVEQCVGRWIRPEQEQFALLGQINCALGEDSTLGEAVYDRSGKFKLCIGPLDFATFCTFLPPGDEFLPLGEHYRTVRELVMFAITDQLEFDVELVLYASEVPDLDLSEDSPCRLGWSTWLGTPYEGAVSVDFPGELRL